MAPTYVTRGALEFLSWPLMICLMIHSNFAFVQSGATLSVSLEDNQKQCFYQDVKTPVRYKVYWRVVRGGLNDIDISLEKPNGEKELDLKKSHHGTHTFETIHGLYTLCFSNEFSTFQHKQVFFSFRPENVESLAIEAGENPVPSVETAMQSSFENIHTHLTDVASTQLDYRNKASLGHNVADHLNDCVQVMSLILAAVIFVIGVGEVMILRLFFTETSGVLKHATVTEYIDPLGTPGI